MQISIVLANLERRGRFIRLTMAFTWSERVAQPYWPNPSRARCTPEEAFAVATDPRRFAEWQHDVVNVRMLGGARFATTRISGAERTMIQLITRSDPPHGWAARGIDGPIRTNATGH
jgi:hypothetical protein